MRGEQSADPCGRGARLGKIDVQVDQDIEIVLVTAEGARLYDIEVIYLPQRRDILGGNASAFFRGVGPRLDLRADACNAGFEFGEGWAFSERQIGMRFVGMPCDGARRNSN